MHNFEEINQSEISRVSELIPEALRKDSHALVGLLEEYYRYMSTVDLPSHILNSLDENYSIDEVSEQYLPKIKEYIAPYVPNSSVLTTKQLYTKIVKYFYNARGSTESALVFFKIFFGKTDTEIFDFTAQLNVGLVSNKWIPYSYGIKTDIPLTEWEVAYRALIHPVGFRFFAFLLFVLYSQNHYDLTAISKEKSADSQKIKDVEKYFCFRTAEVNNDTSFSLLSPSGNPFSNPAGISDYGYSSHSPTYQPGWFETSVRKLFFLFFTEKMYNDASLPYSSVALSYEEISQIAFYVIRNRYENNNHHLQNLRDEYLADNKFRDPSVIGSFMSFIIQDTNIATWYPEDSQFQNVGSHIYFSSTNNILVSGAGIGTANVNGSYTATTDTLSRGYKYYTKTGTPTVYLYRSSGDADGEWRFSTDSTRTVAPLYKTEPWKAFPWGNTYSVVTGAGNAPTVSLA